MKTGLMKTLRDLTRLTLATALAVECGLAQQAQPAPAAEKHVKDFRSAQTQAMISASALCQQVRETHSYVHRRDVDPLTLAPSLFTLMQQSDEVILASTFGDQTSALAPSGQDVVAYFDVKVLRSWKGTHKVGDLVTFAMPWGAVNCAVPVKNGQANTAAVTMTGGLDWETVRYAGPYVLFLRKSQGDETQLTPALRLTAGDGMQGLFVVHSAYDQVCTAVMPGSATKCNASLDASREAVSVRYRLDPLKEKYEGMPVPQFLQEVQATADALGSGQAAVK
jgi:hypothetical protein